jgi:hypothetical protein
MHVIESQQRKTSLQDDQLIQACRVTGAKPTSDYFCAELASYIFIYKYMFEPGISLFTR